MIECNNCGIKFADGIIELHYPQTLEDAVLVFRHSLIQKRITQVFVKMGVPRKPRTTGKGSGSAHFHGHVQQICQYTGDDFDDVKMHIKRKAMKRDYPSHEDSFGEIHPDSEANISTVEESMLIDTAHEVASFLNLKLKEI